MARSKSPRKRKPGKSGKPSANVRVSPPSYPKRFMVSFPPESDYDDPAEFFYNTPEEAIQHCVRFGPQFFLDTQYHPPLVTIIRSFEQHPGQADEAGYDCTDGAMTESMPADVFMVVAGTGVMPVSYAPWDKYTDNWAGRDDEFDCDLYDDFLSSGKIPGL
jgi:hypothetical protein